MALKAYRHFLETFILQPNFYQPNRNTMIFILKLNVNVFLKELKNTKEYKPLLKSPYRDPVAGL